MQKVIAVDFDGTLCSSAWPNIGEPNRALIEQLQEARENGTALILWTCREGKLLKDAVKWCKEQGIEFDQVNKQMPERIRKYKSNSRKISADLYIDDKAADFQFGKRIGGI